MKSSSQDKNKSHRVSDDGGLTLARCAPPVVGGAEAVLGGVGAQVHHLVEAELAAVDRCRLGLQGDDQLLWVFTGHQTGLHEGRHQKGQHTF